MIDYLSKYNDEMVKELQAIVRIKSVEDYPTASENRPFGEGPGEVLEYTLDLCKRLGMRTVNMDGFVGYAEVGEGEELIALLAHLDVVPEGDTSQWEYPPYSATIKDGRIYGRGSSDNKSPAIASIYSLKALMDEGVNMSKRVRLIFGANEESGFKCMQHYVKHAEIPNLGFTPDALFPVVHGEKGITQLTFSTQYMASNNYEIVELHGGNAANNVADTCVLKIKAPDSFTESASKFFCDNGYEHTIEESDIVTIVTSGKSAHGSTPQDGVNAISIMLEMLELCQVEADFVSGYNKKIGFCYDGSKMGCSLEDKYGSLTMNVGKINLIEGRVEFTIDVRYPLSESIDNVFNPISESLKEIDFSVELIMNKNPIYYEIDHPLIEALWGAYRDVTGDTESQPETMGGGTYARAMPNLVAFGGTFPGDENNPHKPNESISIQRLFDQSAVYVEAIKRLLKI